ncbi:MAG TPA: restriction endonuclease [Solirubrobacteraceae bacterium]|nr:restriction endonuclease [Solirubrobacteraceae bacterium]
MAILLAILGWHDLAQETPELTVDWRTQHLLDITVCEPLGEARHLLAECRDWCKVVERSTIDGLIGLRSQAGADVAAVITTSGFTESARLRAVEEEVALIFLRPFRAFRSGDANRFVKCVEMTFAINIPVYSDFDVELISGRGSLRGTQFQIAFDEDHHLLALDGSPAETASEILCASETPAKEGVFRQCATFRKGRLLQVVGNAPIAISSLAWTETVHRNTHTTSIETEGDPIILVERLGDATRGILAERMVVDDDLYAWQVDGEGEVVNRGRIDVRSVGPPRRQP